MIRHYLPIEATHWAVSVRAESTAPSNSDAHTQAYSDTPVTHNTYSKEFLRHTCNTQHTYISKYRVLTNSTSLHLKDYL